jgi:hypothetical protein
MAHLALHLLPLAVSEHSQAEYWGMTGLVVLGVPVQAAQQVEDSSIEAHSNAVAGRVRVLSCMTTTSRMFSDPHPNFS